MDPPLFLQQWEPVLHYIFALATLIFIPSATLVDAFRVDQKPRALGQRRRIHVAILFCIVASYATTAVVSVLRSDILNEGQPLFIQLIVSIVGWTWIALRPADPVLILFGQAIISTLFGITILVLAVLFQPRTDLFIADVVFQSLRLCLLLVVLLLVVVATSKSQNLADAEWDNESDGEQHSTYHDDDDAQSDSSSEDDYGDGEDDGEEAEDAASIKRRRAIRIKETGGWLAYLKDFSVFLPYIVPRRDRKVQLCFLASFFCVVGNRIINVMIPRQIGIVTDLVLAGQSAYGAFAVWLLLNLMDEYHGLGLVESLAKIPIRQFSYRGIANAAFRHVMTLSMDFHSERDAAEVIKAIEQGQSLQQILEVLSIELLPMMCDIVIAMGLFWWKFNALVALIILIAALLFAVIEVVLLERNMNNKRKVSKTERKESRIMHQAFQGWQTVSYFNMFGFERRRYGDAVEAHLKAQWAYESLDAWTNLALDSLDPIVFFCLGVLVLYEVARGEATPGDFIFALQYWQIIVWPLRLLAHNYKEILGNMVNAERLLALLQTKPTVPDRPDAVELGPVVEGHVAFEDVHFQYDERRPTLRSLTLTASPGQTVAFVGATGAGKSTITKLLLRLYDVGAGRITVDGHDIRDVTLGSLRSCMGVVPQDPLLFNASILENLRYARPDAPDEAVFEACRRAAIHDKILTFADGYATKVGEQGVKLSGGEVQRLAIARVFLKDPPVLILDEATSAVDTETESAIQRALDELKKGRTTLVIAHRLSTIVGADKIMVVDEGRVVESGTHAELIRQGGKYSSLWAKQSGGMVGV